MDVLHHDIRPLTDELEPPLLDLDRLAELVGEDEAHAAEGDCTAHAGCRPV